jgi:hypothetical protein
VAYLQIFHNYIREYRAKHVALFFSIVIASETVTLAMRLSVSSTSLVLTTHPLKTASCILFTIAA